MPQIIECVDRLGARFTARAVDSPRACGLELRGRPIVRTAVWSFVVRWAVLSVLSIAVALCRLRGPFRGIQRGSALDRRVHRMDGGVVAV